MNYDVNTVEEYIKAIPEERQGPMNRLREVIKSNLPDGFEECVNYKMIGYVVPHSVYPDGYHCNPKQPLPFINLASQKNYIALYHMCVYSDPNLNEWFTNAYKTKMGKKPDMGKSCIRFKKIDQIPFDLIGELVSKKSPQDWIDIYESALKR